MKYKFNCKCGNLITSIDIKEDDKSGEQCDVCMRVFDVMATGEVKFMPLPSGSTVTLRNVLSGPGGINIGSSL